MSKDQKRIVESAQIDRQISRDTQTDIFRVVPGLDDDANLRYQCLALAIQVGSSFRIGKSDDEHPGMEIIQIADDFLGYVHDGTVPVAPPAPQEVDA